MDGDWADADRLADECIALADRTASSALIGSSIYARGLVDAHLGRLDEARAAGEEIVATSGPDPGRSRPLAARLRRAVARRRATADREYTRAQAIVDVQGQREPARYRFQPDHLEAVVELGDLTRARAMLDALEQRAAVFPAPVDPRESARCRGLVAAARAT